MNLHDPHPQAGTPEPAAEFTDEGARLDVVQSFEAEALEGDPETENVQRFRLNWSLG